MGSFGVWLELFSSSRVLPTICLKDAQTCFPQGTRKSLGPELPTSLVGLTKSLAENRFVYFICNSKNCWVDQEDIGSNYPLVNVYITMVKITIFFMGKLAISMAMFNGCKSNYQRASHQNNHGRKILSNVMMYSNYRTTIWVDIRIMIVIFFFIIPIQSSITINHDIVLGYTFINRQRSRGIPPAASHESLVSLSLERPTMKRPSRASSAKVRWAFSSSDQKQHCHTIHTVLYIYISIYIHILYTYVYIYICTLYTI